MVRRRQLRGVAAAFAFALASGAGALVATDAQAAALDAPVTAAATMQDTTRPPIPREFRGVWVASVANIDWPSKPGLPVAEQQRELAAILDSAAALRLNAVILQVRPAADALYESSIEPWSEFLTGAQGRAPSPRWDPLAWAVREAHARGLELHAWFNPYRARHDKFVGPLHASHIARTNPALVKRYGGYLWMDPGEPAVRRRTMRVIADVVTRYDVDGVHIDDYFYPYPVQDRQRRDVPFPDDASYARYTDGGGRLARDAWRRENVNALVRALNDTIHALKPWVKFGVSPFGIWRPGSPASVRGFDAYERLHADARLWLREGWLDYCAPQLYWPTYKDGQRYGILLDWWAAQNAQRRHLWPGNFTSRTGARGGGAFPLGELLEQVRVTRSTPGATGNVHFSMAAFMGNQARMNDALREGPYAASALVPASPWLRADPPPTPRPVLGRDADGRRTVRLVADGGAPSWWVVQYRAGDGWRHDILPGARTSWTAPTGEPARVVVTAVNRIGITGEPVDVTAALGRE